MSADAALLRAEYFDGLSARPRPVTLRVGNGRLHIAGDGVAIELALEEVRWPERTEHGSRIAHLPDGSSLHSVNTAAWDRWAQAARLKESLVVRSQQSWRGVLVACVVLAAVAVAGFLWGLPLGAQAVLVAVPPSLDRQVGDIALQSIRSSWLKPTAVPPARQEQLRAAFRRAVDAAYPPGGKPAYVLHFHSGDIGPNAFALPGGHMVLTDELVRLLGDDDRAIVGVLAHELGHVHHRHGMRLMVQATLLGAATSVAFGDFSSIVAGVPALVGHMAYSRDFEREADDESIRVMLAAGIPPDVMVKLFERLPLANRDGSIDPPCPPGVQPPARGRDDEPASGAAGSGKPAVPRCREAGAASHGDDDEKSSLGIGFSSHPAHGERIRHFRAATR